MKIKKWKCTGYFEGKDGKGTCDTTCQWYHKEGCPCAKGSKLWDGKEHYTRENKNVPKRVKGGRKNE